MAIARFRDVPGIPSLKVRRRMAWGRVFPATTSLGSEDRTSKQPERRWQVQHDTPTGVGITRPKTSRGGCCVPPRQPRDCQPCTGYLSMCDFWALWTLPEAMRRVEFVRLPNPFIWRSHPSCNLTACVAASRGRTRHGWATSLCPVYQPTKCQLECPPLVWQDLPAGTSIVASFAIGMTRQ